VQESWNEEIWNEEIWNEESILTGNRVAIAMLLFDFVGPG